MLVEGAIFRLIRGFVDHHSRRAFLAMCVVGVRQWHATWRAQRRGEGRP